MEAASQKFVLCHLIPSRLRVKVEDIRHEEKAAAALEHWLATQVGVQGVTANPVTGSVILHYDSGVTPVQSIFDLLEEGVTKLPQLLEAVPWPCPKPLTQREPRGELALKMGLAKVIGLTGF